MEAFLAYFTLLIHSMIVPSMSHPMDNEDWKYNEFVTLDNGKYNLTQTSNTIQKKCPNGGYLYFPYQGFVTYTMYADGIMIYHSGDGTSYAHLYDSAIIKCELLSNATTLEVVTHFHSKLFLRVSEHAKVSYDVPFSVFLRGHISPYIAIAAYLIALMSVLYLPRSINNRLISYYSLSLVGFGTYLIMCDGALSALLGISLTNGIKISFWGLWFGTMACYMMMTILGILPRWVAYLQNTVVMAVNILLIFAIDETSALMIGRLAFPSTAIILVYISYNSIRMYLNDKTSSSLWRAIGITFYMLCPFIEMIALVTEAKWNAPFLVWGILVYALVFGHVVRDLMDKTIEEKHELDSEVHSAQVAQQQLLPIGKSHDAGIARVQWGYRGASRVSGDLLNYIHDEIHNRLYMVIGDVTGHGMSATLTMGAIHGVIFTAFDLHRNEPMHDVIAMMGAHTQSAMRRRRTQGKFITMFIIGIDLDTMESFYIQAGHPGTMIYRNGKFLVTQATCSPFGMDSLEEIHPKALQLDKLDVLFTYTDGILENTSINGAQTLSERRRQIRNIVSNNSNILSTKHDMDTLLDTLVFEDDCSYCVLDFKGVPNGFEHSS